MAKSKVAPKVPAVLKSEKPLATLQKERAQALDSNEQNPRKQAWRDKFKAVTDPVQLAKDLQTAQQGKEALEERLKNANAAYDVLRLELIPALFESQGIERIVVEGVGRVQLAGDAYVSIKSGKKDEFFAWLKKNKLAALIQPAVASSTLKASIKERLLASKPVPSELLNVTPFTRASITKA